jgi:hypothetical protein
VWSGVVIVALIVIATAPSSTAKTSWLPSGAVKGRFDGSLPSQVTADHVYCHWVNGQVEVHVRFTNHDFGENTHSVVYTPRYEIFGASHGDSVGNFVDEDIPAGQSVDVTTDAGTPEGVADNSPIGACTPGK